MALGLRPNTKSMTELDWICDAFRNSCSLDDRAWDDLEMRRWSDLGSVQPPILPPISQTLRLRVT